MEGYKFIKDQIASLTRGKVVKKNGEYVIPLLLIVIGIVALIAIHYLSQRMQRSPFLVFASVLAFSVVCGGVFIFVQTKAKYVYTVSKGEFLIKKIVLIQEGKEQYFRWLKERNFHKLLGYEAKESSDVFLEIWVDQPLTIAFVQLMIERNRIPFPISEVYQLSKSEMTENCELFYR
ncbi:hypothetical protein [uncultured Sanguibacteroides sp.]|uniref:hypothetical protein n=1 Tax=uncultured Sanguibacteroides sp. TaxID=1635151 RepID=UPI0025F5C7CE|nr:hypothetical protein [uncultured Sanguibacteroides sp.]